MFHPIEDIQELKSDFTISALIADSAFPWNRTPIIAQEDTISLNSNLDQYCWLEDIVINSPRHDFYVGVSPLGYLGLMIGTNEGWIICRSESNLPLKKWVHVVAVFNRLAGVEIFACRC